MNIMNKKLFAFVGLISMAASAMMAQTETNVFWGKDNPLPKSGSIYLLGKRGNSIVGYKKDGKNVSIITYSYDDLQVSGEVPVIGKTSKDGGKVISKDYTFDQILILKDKNYVCVTAYDKSSKGNTLYMQEFDNSGHLQGGLKKIITMDAKSKHNTGAFDFIVCKDSSKFMLVDIPPVEKNSSGKFNIEIVDQNLNILNTAQISLPNIPGTTTITEDAMRLSNDGMAYMMAEITEQRNTKVKGEAGFYFQLFAINPKGNGDITTYDLKLPEKAITDISYSLEEGKYIVCSGFYGNVKGSKYSTGQIDGIFYFRINKETKEIESTGVKPLDRDFIADLTSEKSANKGKGISNNFTITNFTKRGDGGAILIAEYRDFYVIAYSDKNGTHYVYHYIRNNIIVININPDGSIKWYANIPKKQHTQNDGGLYSSYMYAIKGDKMEFVYNDDARNYDPNHPRETTKDLKTMTSPSKSMAVLVELSSSGQFTKSPLFNNKENKSTLTPSKALSIGNSELIVPSVHIAASCCFFGGSSKYKLARFEFK